jgi:nucleoside-diphosphate-sugar epimerase
VATCEKRKAVPMRVLVLGSRGVIGRALVRRLISSGYVVKERDILISREHDLSSASTLSKLANIIDDSDFVFFLAYDVGGSKYISNPTLQFMNNNSRIMLNTFPLLARKRFIFASSTMSNMNIAYGALKMVGEHYTKILGGVSARFWNVYGRS